MKTFYLVWNEHNRNQLPTKKHELYTDACTEAERLAKLNPEQMFCVLEAKAHCKAESHIKWSTVIDTRDMNWREEVM